MAIHKSDLQEDSLSTQDSKGLYGTEAKLQENASKDFVEYLMDKYAAIESSNLSIKEDDSMNLGHGSENIEALMQLISKEKSARVAGWQERVSSYQGVINEIQAKKEREIDLKSEEHEIDVDNDDMPLPQSDDESKEEESDLDELIELLLALGVKFGELMTESYRDDNGEEVNFSTTLMSYDSDKSNDVLDILAGKDVHTMHVKSEDGETKGKVHIVKSHNGGETFCFHEGDLNMQEVGNTIKDHHQSMKSEEHDVNMSADMARALEEFRASNVTMNVSTHPVSGPQEVSNSHSQRVLEEKNENMERY